MLEIRLFLNKSEVLAVVTFDQSQWSEEIDLHDVPVDAKVCLVGGAAMRDPCAVNDDVDVAVDGHHLVDAAQQTLVVDRHVQLHHNRLVEHSLRS